MKKPIITCMIVPFMLLFAITTGASAQERTIKTSSNSVKEQENKRVQDRRAAQTENAKGSNPAESTLTTPEQKTLSADDFNALPEKRQQYIKANPEKFKVVEKSSDQPANSSQEKIQTKPSQNSNSPSNTELKSISRDHRKDIKPTDPRSKTIIYTDEYNQMSPEKKGYVDSHPELYKIKTSQAVQQTERKSSVSGTKSTVTKEELNAMPAEKRAYIENHPELYQIENK